MISKILSLFRRSGPRKYHENVTLGRGVRIANDAKLEIRFGGSIDIKNNTEVLDGALILTYGGTILIGSNCSINPYTVIYGHGNTSIGNNVLIASHCMIVPSSHNFKSKDKLIWDQGNTAKGITIGDDVWIGHGCSILDGVTIGNGAVIAAGSVVNSNLEQYTVYGGAPARKIGMRE